MRLERSFFERNPQTVAKELLGCFLVRKTEEGIIRGMIVETEAYGDTNDLASHARFGMTKRNQIMYQDPGLLYIYHIYGIFYLSNLICEKQGTPSAVLLRSCEIIDGKKLVMQNIVRSKFVKADEKLATGPGKLSIAFGLTKFQNSSDIVTDQEIWIESSQGGHDIIETTRVGIAYAKHCAAYAWRYYLKGNPYVSKP